MAGPALVDCDAGPRVAIAVGNTLHKIVSIPVFVRSAKIEETNNDGSEFPANLHNLASIISTFARVELKNLPDFRVTGSIVADDWCK